jgi:hypothetical protein
MNNLIVETKSFNLSTRASGGKILNVDTDYKSLIEYTIPDMIVLDESIEFIQFSIPYAVIPISFYQINHTNNKLDVLEDGEYTTYTFSEGNYSAFTFIQQFVQLLGTRWNIILNNFDSIFSISNTTNSFTFFKSSTITSVMGFSTDLSSTFNTTESVHVLAMTRVCNFFPLPRVCIRCQQLVSNNLMIGAYASNDVVLSIPNNAKSNGQLYYQNQSGAKLLYKGNNLSKITVSLTDDDNNLLNFNGISSFFIIQFDIFRNYIPKPLPFHQILNFVNSQQRQQEQQQQEQN